MSWKTVGVEASPDLAAVLSTCGIKTENHWRVFLCANMEEKRAARARRNWWVLSARSMKRGLA